MFNEVSKQASTAMSPANFRHGPVEIVDARFRAILFATQPAALSLDLALAADLARFGGQARVVTPPGVDAAVPAWTLPGMDSRLAPVFEAIPVQIAAWRLAQWRGVPLGVFRYASQVTRAEAWSAGTEPRTRT
jgi:glucosamine--fructose-6-phosphate aminotransferase (isomerizing)